ncbi:hypothetical protein QVD17_16859 [Tagetes erecta]|uniref:Uncharacterized protein n=1 Tax=Tagetes erecta TaxID=13708 RepID=A0AAD8KS23_TARER|nr:hypothetical protein QVD17_16859 [Tagetes erecta]
MERKPPPPMKFDKRSNMVAYLNDKDPKSVGFRDAISWMKASPIFYAVTKDPVMDQQHICDFWESASYNLNADLGEIRATVMGEHIVLTVDSIAQMLRMERDVGSPVLLSLTDVYEGFLEMGYEGTDFLDRREIKKTFMSKEWRFIAHIIIVCLDHRKGGTDGLNFEWARAMLNLCKCDKASIPQMIFGYMIENISSAQKDKWLLYPRFIQIFIDHLKPNLQKLGDVLVLTPMNVKIFADCAAPRHDVSGKITYLFRNMYTDERWEYIENLKPVSFEEEIDEIEAEIFKTRGKKKRKAVDRSPSHTETDTDVRRKKAKGKQPSASENVPGKFRKKTEKKGAAGLDEDVIRGLNTSLANELSMVKTKLMNLEERERHRESEMEDLRKIVLDQQCLIRKLLLELNEVKKEVKVGNTKTEEEINELVSIAKYQRLKERIQTGTSRRDFGGFSAAGGSETAEKETEVADDFCLDIDTDLGGEKVVAEKEKSESMKLVDEEEEEQLVDYDSEPAFYEIDEKEMVDVA